MKRHERAMMMAMLAHGMPGAYGLFGAYPQPAERPFDKETTPETQLKIDANRKAAEEEARAKAEAKRLRKAARKLTPEK
jgi:hypothetical protein